MYYRLFFYNIFFVMYNLCFTYAKNLWITFLPYILVLLPCFQMLVARLVWLAVIFWSPLFHRVARLRISVPFWPVRQHPELGRLYWLRPLGQWPPKRGRGIVAERIPSFLKNWKKKLLCACQFIMSLSKHMPILGPSFPSFAGRINSFMNSYVRQRNR